MEGPDPRRRIARPWIVGGMALSMGTIALVGFLYLYGQAGIVGSALIVGIATLPPVVLGGLVLYLDRFEPEPRFLLVSVFAAGGTVAVAITMFINVPWIGVTAALVGNTAADLVGSVLYAPFTEEIAKGLAVLSVYIWRRSEIHGVVDGIVYGTMAGLGFAFTENLLYFSDALAISGEEFVATVFLRAGLSGFAHPLFTAMTGMGLAIAAEGGRTRWVWPFVGLAGGMGLHAIWNLTAVLGAAWYVAYVVFFGPILIIAVGAAVGAARRESAIVSEQLAGDVRAGLLTAAEVQELASVRIRRAALAHYEGYGGLVGRDARAQFQKNAIRLAFERNRTRASEKSLIERAEEAQLVREIARYKRWVDPQWVPPAGLG